MAAKRTKAAYDVAMGNKSGRYMARHPAGAVAQFLKAHRISRCKAMRPDPETRAWVGISVGLVGH